MTDQERSTWQQYRQELFNHFAQNHDLHLLSSELDEIECIVARKPAEAFPKVDKAIAEYLENHLAVEHLESDAFAADICLLFAPAIAEVVTENNELRERVKQLRSEKEKCESLEKQLSEAVALLKRGEEAMYYNEGKAYRKRVRSFLEALQPAQKEQ